MSTPVQYVYIVEKLVLDEDGDIRDSNYDIDQVFATESLANKYIDLFPHDSQITYTVNQVFVTGV